MIIPEVKDKELHRIATTTLIYKPDFRYLIIKRAMHKKVMPGKWVPPGGGLNVDDYINMPTTPEDVVRWPGVMDIALRREIREEVGLDIGQPELYNNVAFIRPDGIPVINFCYFAPYVSGEVKLDDDCVDSAWVTLIEAKNYDLIGGIWDEIHQVDEILKSRVK